MSLPESQLDQAALTREDFCRQFAAIFACHRAFDALDDLRNRAAVVFELLRAMVNRDARALADALVVGALIGILGNDPNG